MKKQESTTSQMDDIVFEHRNKTYGAFILRKTYNKQLIKGLLLSTAILITGLAYPVVASYNANEGGKTIWVETGTEIFTNDDPEDVVKPPVPLPPPVPEIKNRFVFKAPEIVEGPVESTDGLPDQDYLNKYMENIPVDVAREPTEVKKPDVIDEPTAKQETFITAEEMPIYPGGDVARQKFLAENIQYPQSAADIGLQGTVYVQFVVDSKGNITDVKVLRGIGGGCDEEAVRVLKMMPQWFPGKQNGKTVRVLYNMAIGFKLQG